MPKTVNLQQELEELEKIVTWFEAEDIDVEAAITKFEEGAKRADAIREQLDALENKITVLKQRFDQAE